MPRLRCGSIARVTGAMKLVSSTRCRKVPEAPQQLSSHRRSPPNGHGADHARRPERFREFCREGRRSAVPMNLVSMDGRAPSHLRGSPTLVTRHLDDPCRHAEAALPTTNGSRLWRPILVRMSRRPKPIGSPSTKPRWPRPWPGEAQPCGGRGGRLHPDHGSWPQCGSWSVLAASSSCRPLLADRRRVAAAHPGHRPDPATARTPG